MKIKKILAIGSAGLIGFGLVRAMSKKLGSKNIIIGDTAKPQNPNTVFLDILDPTNLQKNISTIKPDLIVHLAAATNVNACEKDPRWATKLNVKGTKNVLHAANQIPIIFFSTDFVFSGTTPNLKKESDTPDPLSVYGKTKYQAEQLLLNSTNPGATFRISFPWYQPEKHPQNIASRDTLYWIRETLLKGQDVPAYTNVTAGWTAMSYLEDQFISLVHLALTKDIKLLHLAGAKPATVYQTATALRKNLIQQGISENSLGQIKKGFCKPEPGQIASRPAKGGLDTTLAQSMGWNQPSILQMLKS